MKKRKMVDGTELDVQVLGSLFGFADEYYEYYYPEDAKKERLEQIENIKTLIDEFKKTGDNDSLKYAEERLKLAEGAYNDFIDTVYNRFKDRKK